MLPARARLTHRDDFTRTVRGGRRAGRDALVVHWLPAGPTEGDGTAEDRPARVGFVVSKAVGPAVTRNLVARRLRHLVRERVGMLPTRSRMVVRALPAAARTPYDQLGTDLDAALDRVLRRGGSR